MLRRKYIIGALLGLLLGFIGQLTVDFFFAHFLEHRGEIQDVTAYQVILENETKGARDARLKRFLGHVRPLLLQGLFLCWLAQRGEVACRTSLIVALLVIASMHTAEQYRQKRMQL